MDNVFLHKNDFYRVEEVGGVVELWLGDSKVPEKSIKGLLKKELNAFQNCRKLLKILESNSNHGFSTCSDKSIIISHDMVLDGQFGISAIIRNDKYLLQLKIWDSDKAKKFKKENKNYIRI